MAAEKTRFARLDDGKGGMIFTNLNSVWEMSDNFYIEEGARNEHDSPKDPGLGD